MRKERQEASQPLGRNQTQLLEVCIPELPPLPQINQKSKIVSSEKLELLRFAEKNFQIFVFVFDIKK